MKVVIFSDTHLGRKFNRRQFSFLKGVISQADQVIINGDFWDHLFLNFDEFVRSPWKRLFPLLKKKKTIYVFGNHDLPEENDKRMQLFSDFQGEEYRLKLKNKTLLITHGHRFPISFFEWLKKLHLPYFIFPILSRIKNILVAILPTLVHHQFRRLNKELKEKIKKEKILGKEEILVCGHTHAAEIDLKHHFIDTGYVGTHYASYLLADTKTGQLTLKEKYFPLVSFLHKS